jgi:hypothetical protein
LLTIDLVDDLLAAITVDVHFQHIGLQVLVQQIEVSNGDQDSKQRGKHHSVGMAARLAARQRMLETETEAGDMRDHGRTAWPVEKK